MKSLKSLLRLKPYLRKYMPLILISTGLAIPLSGLRVSLVPLIKYLVDDLLISRDSKKLILLPLIVIGLYIANFFVRFFHYYLLRIVIGRVNQEIKNDLFQHLIGLSADYFSAQSTGTLMSRAGVDPNYIDHGISCINVLIREPVTFFFLFGYAFHLNWKLTLITIIIFPPLAWVFAATGRNLKRYIANLSEESAKLYSRLQESFSGIRVVKIFRLEKYIRKKFRERSDAFTRYYLKISAVEEAAHPLVELLIACLAAIMVYFGGGQVLQGNMSSGDLLAFIAAFAMMVNPLRSLNEVNMKLHQAAGACDRIFEVFDWQSNLKEIPRPKLVQGIRGQIEIKNVSFAYPDAPGRLVLKNLSFTLKKGRTVALVGASGAGKSSLVSLIPRIFDVTGGSIEIDGIDIREASLSSLRSQIAVVSQDVFLFNDTIEENIRCGKLSASHEEIISAARKANALEFIEMMPHGIQSVIGDRGQKLSGGQRQRISIARAFLREAPILILDEATSSLDTAAERTVQTAIEELMQNRTTLIIAHRLSTVQHADQILVMKDGEIVEAGSHEDLLKGRGEYANFYELGGA